MRARAVFVGAAIATLAAVPAWAQDVAWPDEIMDWVSWSAEDVLAAETEADRASALQAFLYDLRRASQEDLPGAALTVLVLDLQLDGEEALAAMRSGLGRALMADPDSAAQSSALPAARFLQALEALQRHGPRLPSAGLATSEGLRAVERALQAQGSTALKEQLAQLSGSPELYTRLLELAEWAQQVADLADDAAGIADGDAQAAENFINGFMDMIPPNLAPAMAGPLRAAFVDQQRWQQEMTQAATDGLNTVADAIETGRFDHERFQEIADRLEDLGRGPWGGDTARDAIRRWCGHLPIGSSVCEAAVDIWQGSSEEDLCEAAVNCDCENSEYMFPSVSIPQCYGYEEQARQECRQSGRVTGIGCDPITSGPAAFPL